MGYCNGDGASHCSIHKHHTDTLMLETFMHKHHTDTLALETLHPQCEL